MTIRVQDPALLNELLGAGDPVALVGPDGEPLGLFTPGPVDPLELEMGISRAEMDRRLNSPKKGYTTEQVLAHLRGL